MVVALPCVSASDSYASKLFAASPSKATPRRFFFFFGVTGTGTKSGSLSSLAKTRPLLGTCHHFIYLSNYSYRIVTPQR